MSMGTSKLVCWWRSPFPLMGYFTNSALGTFARVLIDKHGNKACDMEVLVRHPYPSPREIHDDFAL